MSSVLGIDLVGEQFLHVDAREVSNVFPWVTAQP